MNQYANERKHVCKDAMCMHKYMINNIDKQYNLPNNNSNVACYLQLKDNEKNIKFQNNIPQWKKDRCYTKD